MLQTMRRLAHSWVVKGLMLILMISFSIWGIGDIFRGNPLRETVANIGPVDISVQDLNRLFEETLARVRQQNPDMTGKHAREIGLLDRTLDNEIKRQLVDQDIKRLGIAVSPKEVLNTLAAQPQFRKSDGTFNKALFQQLLEHQGLSEQAFLIQGQQDLSRQVLLDSLNGSGAATQTMIDAVYRGKAQTRVFDVVTVDSSKMPVPAAPDDRTLQTFYDAHKDLFTAPEYRSLTIGVLASDSFAKDATISDDQVRKAYDEAGDRLTHPEQRDIVQVVVPTEAEAKKLAALARSGGLDKAAKDEKLSAVPLDHVAAGDLLPELATPVFALQAGQVSDPVHTQLGWHVVAVKTIIPAGKPDFNAAKDQLRDDLQRDQAVEAATRMVNQLDDDLAAGKSLDDIADALKMSLVKIPAVDARGLNPKGDEPTEFPNREVLLKDAFNQNAGDTSPVEDDKSGTYYVVRTEDVTPAAARPFDTIKPQVLAMWTSHEQLTAANAEAERIATDLRAGKPLDSVTGLPGVSSRVSSPISALGDSDPLLPPDILAQAMRMKKGEVATAASERNQVVARLKQINVADVSGKDPRQAMIEGQLIEGTRGELLDEYIAHLYRVFPVKIDTPLVDRLRQQGG